MRPGSQVTRRAWEEPPDLPNPEDGIPDPEAELEQLLARQEARAEAEEARWYRDMDATDGRWES